MPTTIPAFLRNPQLTGYVRTTDVPKNYLFERWCPSEGVEADEFEGLVVLDQVQMAPFVAVDAESPKINGDLISSYKWQVAFMRHKARFKESDLRVFWEPGVDDPNTLAFASSRARETKIRRAIDALSMGVDARKEWVFWNAMAGSVAYDDENIQYEINFDGAYIGSSNRKTPDTLWSAASPTPITDLSDWIEEISDESGIDEWIMVTTPKVLGLLSRSEQVRQMWSVFRSNPAAAEPDSLNPVTPVQVSGAMQQLGIMEVIKYTAKYTSLTYAVNKTATRTKTRFINDNDIFLLPANQQLGRFASAPAMANNWMSGKFGWNKQETDPWVLEVGAGEYAWIDFPPPMHNSVLQARVA